MGSTKWEWKSLGEFASAVRKALNADKASVQNCTFDSEVAQFAKEIGLPDRVDDRCTLHLSGDIDPRLAKRMTEPGSPPPPDFRSQIIAQVKGGC